MMTATPTPEMIESDRLSTYRTRHRFLHYGEFTTPEEYQAWLDFARSHELPVFILGNGSNTLYARKEIRTLVLRNRLDRWLKPLDVGLIEVSSASPILEVLRYCQKNKLESFYYLASVPATIGGAIAMNAGRGRSWNQSIFDFVVDVTFWEDGRRKTLPAEQIKRDYRWTIFTGLQDRLILSATMKFERSEASETTGIQDRIEYSKATQDHSKPNCGSVFKEADGRIMALLRRLSFGKTCWSAKTTNWILSGSASSRPILRLIRFARLLHWFRGRRPKLELIVVE